MDVYAFVFARGGSVGLPGKNIKLFHGLPLLAHSILLAKKLKEVKKIFVSTDSKEIAEVGEAYGANIIFRPEHLASSTASEWLAWQHAIRYLQNDLFDTFLSLPTTSPLRNVNDVENCLHMLTPETDLVLCVTPSSRNPYFNMVIRDDNGSCKILNNNHGVTRRQDAPQTYDITTVAYASRPEFILKHDSLFSGRVKSAIVPKERAIDIDDEYDFIIAETLYNRINNESR